MDGMDGALAHSAVPRCGLSELGVPGPFVRLGDGGAGVSHWRSLSFFFSPN